MIFEIGDMIYLVGVAGMAFLLCWTGWMAIDSSRGLRELRTDSQENNDDKQE